MSLDKQFITPILQPSYTVNDGCYMSETLHSAGRQDVVFVVEPHVEDTGSYF